VTNRIVCLSFALFACAHTASAQGVTLSESDPKRWDATVTIGWLGGDKEDLTGRWNSWYDSFATSVDVGRYWTTHFKTEAGAVLTTDGTVYAQEQVIVPGRPTPIFFSREYRFGVRALNLSAVYQLFENEWVHPFVAGGVHLGWERQRVETPFVPPFAGGPLPPPPPDRSGTVFEAQPFLSGGVKFYVNERGFIRTDLSAAFDRRGATRMWWRVGAGVDF